MHADTEQLQRQKALGAIAALRLPTTWKLEGYDTTRLHADPESDLQSVGAIYTDTDTRGIEMKRYKIVYHVFSERLAVVEKSIIDFGKYKYSCLTSNCTIEQMNNYLEGRQSESA